MLFIGVVICLDLVKNAYLALYPGLYSGKRLGFGTLHHARGGRLFGSLHHAQGWNIWGIMLVGGGGGGGYLGHYVMLVGGGISGGITLLDRYGK